MSKEIKYKDTGIPYCPQIPESWNVKRLKFVGKSIIGITYNPTQVTDEENGKLVLRSSNVQNGVLSFEDNVYVNSEISDKHLSKEGDILICARNGSAHLVGKCAYIHKEYEGLTFGAFMLMFRSEFGKFMYYVFNSNLFKSQTGLYKTSTINQLTSDTINNLFVALPSSKNEQEIIAKYLDDKTTQIDNIIERKQKLIEYLKEERIVIINQVVSKGLNSNIEMKNTDVEWIGEIPKHWECIKFNHYVFLKHGFQFRDNDFTTSGIKIVKITQLKPDGSLDTTNASFIDESRLNDFKEIVIENGDILMALTGGTIGKIVRASGISETLLQNYRVGNFFPTSEKLEKDFLFWVLSSQVILGQLFFAQRETGQPNIGKEDFSRMKFALPPTNEQIEIAEFLSNENEKFEMAISKITKEIELIAEYKSSIINEVVTGKILLN